MKTKTPEQTQLLKAIFLITLLSAIVYQFVGNNSNITIIILWVAHAIRSFIDDTE